jgi:hypothetical protein
MMENNKAIATTGGLFALLVLIWLIVRSMGD